MNQSRTEALAKVTIDSSLMYPTTTRRFLMCLWEMDGLRIELVPRTAKEMHGFVQDSERAYWRRGLRKEGERTGRGWPPQIIEAIAEATATAAANWVRIPVKLITGSGAKLDSDSGQTGHRSERSDAGVGL